MPYLIDHPLADVVAQIGGRARQPSHSMKRARVVLLENIIANYAYVLVMGLVTLAVTPVYIRELGSTHWGIVALCMTAQGALLLLDAGLGQIMPREIARATTTGHAWHAYSMALRLYAVIAIFACVVGQLSVTSLTNALLPSNVAAQLQLEQSLRLVLLQFLFQFPNNAAIAYWNGTEQQKTSSIRLASFAIAKHGAALVLVTWWQPTAVAYMLPFAVVSAVEFAANTLRVARASRRDDASSPAVPVSIGALLVSTGGFSVAVILGMLTAQVDRLYLARSVSVELFGIYVVASNLALTLMHLQGPIQRAFLPRIVISERPPWKLISQMLGLSSLVCLLPCVVIALLAHPILLLWLSDPVIAQAGAPVFQLIAVSVGLNGLYGCIYTLFIRDNQHTRVIALNVFILAAQFAFLFVFTDRLSIVAGGWAWLLCSIIQATFGLVTLVLLRRAHHGD